MTRNRYSFSDIIATIACFLIIAAIMVMGAHSFIEEQDMRNGIATVKAVIVRTVDNEITVETTDGNIFVFYGEGFDNATQVMLTFQDNQIVDAAAI